MSRNLSRKLACRRVRAWLQDRHDREREAQRIDPAAEAREVGDRAVEHRAVKHRAAEVREVVDLEVRAHLEGCAGCQRFQEFLSNFGRELAGSLEAVAGGLPQTDPAAWLASPAAKAAARPTARARGPGAAFPPVRARRPGARSAARWAVPAAAAALLAIAAGTQAPRLAAGALLQRSLRAETAILVEELFSQPLAQGVETGLAGAGQLEGLSQGDGLQGLGEGEEPAGQPTAEPTTPASEPLSP